MKASLFLFMLCIIFALFSCDKDKNETPTKCDCPCIEDSLWVRTNGPYGVYVYDIKINSNDDIFALTTNDGIFKSIDKGDNWQQVVKGLPINNPDYYYGNFFISENNEMYIGAYYYRVDTNQNTI